MDSQIRVKKRQATQFVTRYTKESDSRSIQGKQTEPTLGGPNQHKEQSRQTRCHCHSIRYGLFDVDEMRPDDWPSVAENSPQTGIYLEIVNALANVVLRRLMKS